MREGSRVDAFLHLVWTTWHRQPWLSLEVRDPVYRCIVAECKVLRADVLSLNGTADHVHLLARSRSTVTIADLARRVKGASSHLVNHPLAREGFRRQDGYAALTISRWDVPRLVGYIKSQEEHHRCGSEKPALEIMPSAEVNG